MTTRPTVIILAAGENSRFFPFNTVRHKASYELNGEPLIVRTLRSLEAHHCYDVVIVVSEKDYGGKGLSAQLQEYDLFLKISFVLQDQAHGMGAAILLAEKELGDSFVVVSPHTIDAGDMIEELMKNSGEDGAITVSQTDRPWMYGVIKSKGKRITGIIEKPEKGKEPSNLKARCWLLSHKFLSVLRDVPAQQYSFEAALDVFFKEHEVFFVQRPDALPSYKYPWHLFEFQQVLFDRLSSYTADDAQIAPTSVIDDSHGPVVIESGASIGHAAKIVGPCYIGRHAVIGDYSFVRGSSIEQDCTVGANTEVVRSILFPHVDIHFGYLADSIVASGAKIGAGLITANKRHDREHIKVIVKGEKVDAGRNNLGIMVGEKAKIGVRVTTMPGIAIGAGAIIYPAMTLYGNVAHGEVAK